MSGTLRVRLADGSEIEATVEGALTGNLRDLLAVGYVGNQMRIATDESADVSGHALATTVLVRLFDEDDVEGHALTLHLPNAQAAQDLQRKLLAAGVAGLIVVGAATTAVVAPNLTSPAAPVAAPAPITQTVPVAPDAGSQYQVSTDYGQATIPSVAEGIYPGTTTPGYGQSIVPPAAQGVYPTTGAVSQPAVAPGVAAEIAGGDMAAGTGYGESAVPDVAVGVYPAAASQSHAGYIAAPSQAVDADSHAGYQAAPSQAGDVAGLAESHAGYIAAPSQAVDADSHAGYQAAPSQAGDVAGLAESHAGYIAAPSQAVDADSHAGYQAAPSQAGDVAGLAESHAGYIAAPSQAVDADSHAGYQAAPSQAATDDIVAPGLKADLAAGDVDEDGGPAPSSDRIGGR